MLKTTGAYDSMLRDGSSGVLENEKDDDDFMRDSELGRDSVFNKSKN